MLIKEMALRFRKKEYHRAEMDRNTSLLIVSKHSADEDVDTSSKVKIEDDPYYFKKYVFSYDEIGLENANNWLTENVQKGTTVSLIQDYITDTRQFAKYKENNINEPIYTFFIELVTKLHCFPMKTAETKNIKTIDSFLENELDILRTKQKKPIDIDQRGIEAFVDMDIDYANVNDVCEKWNLIFGSAIGTAITNGERNFDVIVAVRGQEGEESISPCGNCRQILHDYMPNCDIILSVYGELKKIKAKELLPYSYSVE